jgi:hypothetical protein
MCITRVGFRGLVACLLALACALSACADTPSPEESARKRCIALRDHLIDLRLATVNQSVDAKAHRKAFQEALGERFLEDCTQLPQSQVECSLRAVDSETATECVSSSQ